MSESASALEVPGAPGAVRAEAARRWGLGLAILALAGASCALLATRWAPLAVFPALGVLGLHLLHREPSVGLYLILFLVPFGGFRKIDGPVDLNIPWILAYFTILIAFLHFLPGKRTPVSLKSNLWPWLFGFLAVSLLSAVGSPFPLRAATHVGLLAAAMLFIGLGLVLIPPDKLRTTLPAVLVGSISLSSLMAVAGYFMDLPVLSEEQGHAGLVRGLGGAIDPNNMALMILFALPLLVYGAVWAERRAMRLGCVALVVVNLLAVVSTYSRGGAVMLALTMLLLTFDYRRQFTPRNVGMLGAVAGMLLAGVVALVPAEYWTRQQTLLKWQDVSLSRRTSYLVVGMDATLDRPVLGSGPGTFRDLYVESEIAGNYLRQGLKTRRYAHNSYLEVLVGTGLVGLALFLALLVQGWRNFSRALGVFEATADAAPPDSDAARSAERDASLIRAYRTGFVAVALYLAIFSDVYHKYLLLSLAVSQIAMHLAAPTKEENPS